MQKGDIMKAVKVILTIIAVIVLFAAESLVMGLFSVDRAISAESVREAMDESDIIAEMVDEVLTKETVNMGGEYGYMVNAIFRTEAMNGFFTDYITSAVNSQLYGEKYEEIADDEFMSAFSDAIDEVNESGDFSISPMEEELIKQEAQRQAPDFTESLNRQVEQYETLSGDSTEAALEAQLSENAFMHPAVRIILTLFCAALCAAVIALCWKSRLGFLWCCITTGIASLIFRGLYAFTGTMDFSSPDDQMVYIMVQKGFGSVSAAGFAVTAVFLLAFIVFKLLSRRKTNEKDTEITERIA